MFEVFKQFWVKENLQLGDERNIAQHLSRVLLYEWKGLNCLHPQVRSKAKELIDKCEEKGLYISINTPDLFRTVKQQNDYYDKGRKSPGSLITNAQGLESYHNYGLAFDVLFDGPVSYLPDDHWKWKEVGKVGESLGLEWGGRWGDSPHFEYHPFTSWEKLKTYFEKL